MSRTTAAVLLLLPTLAAGAARQHADNSASAVSGDPLKRVAVYNGKWHSEDESFDTKFSKASRESVEIVNTCSTEGGFYVCHQQVSKPSGAGSAMVIFLWNDKARLFDTYVVDSGGGETYHGHLVIDGNTFTWGSAARKESGPQWRTVNVFSGRDHIAYRIQYSTDDAANWITTRQGKETRDSQPVPGSRQ